MIELIFFTGTLFISAFALLFMLVRADRRLLRGHVVKQYEEKIATPGDVLDSGSTLFHVPLEKLERFIIPFLQVLFLAGVRFVAVLFSWTGKQLDAFRNMVEGRVQIKKGANGSQYLSDIAAHREKFEGKGERKIVD